MSRRAGPEGFGAFLLIWFGQSVSLVGSGLTGFALGVWVYQRTGSVTQFALISLFTTLPGIVFSPIAGALVDRWDRRRAMILSDSGAGVCTLGMALLLMADRLEVWQIYVAMAISSTFSAFQWPAYSAATTLLVPKEQLGRASGMVQVGEAVAQIVSPVLAGVLMGTIGLQGVMLIDVATLLFALGTLLVVRIPRPGRPLRGRRHGDRCFARRPTAGPTSAPGPVCWDCCSSSRLTNFAIGHRPGAVHPAGAELHHGRRARSAPVHRWAWLPGRQPDDERVGRPKAAHLRHPRGQLAVGRRPVRGRLSAAPLDPRRGRLPVFFSLPITNGCSQAIWQSKTAPDVQGRVFAMRRMIAWASLPLAYLAGGPLADHVFEPLMVEGGPLAGSVGRIIGVGEGRGIGLLFVVLGGMILLSVLAAWLYPRVRHVDTELADHAGSAQALCPVTRWGDEASAPEPVFQLRVTVTGYSRVKATANRTIAMALTVSPALPGLVRRLAMPAASAKISRAMNAMVPITRTSVDSGRSPSRATTIAAVPTSIPASEVARLAVPRDVFGVSMEKRNGPLPAAGNRGLQSS